MKSATLSNGSGPRSSITLSPTSIHVRDAIIEKFIDKSLDELNNFLTSALETERDESKRIGILAARVYILRTRISKIMEFNQNSMIPSIDDITPDELVNKLHHLHEPILSDEPSVEDKQHLEEWNELLTLEDGEINGVRIPRGVAITVGRNDATRLIETGKAELINEEKTAEKPSDEQDAMTNSPDMLDMNTEAENPTDEKDTTPNPPDMPDLNTEADIGTSEQMPIEQTVDISADGEESAVQVTKADIEASEQMPVEQTNEISADEIQTAPETAVEGSDMSVEDTVAGNVETNLQEPSSSDDMQTHYVDETEIDETKPQK